MTRKPLYILIFTLMGLLAGFDTYSKNGYDLWLRYVPVENAALLETYRSNTARCYIPGNSETIRIIADEINLALTRMLDQAPELPNEPKDANLIIQNEALQWVDQNELDPLGSEGYLIKTLPSGQILITANTETGLLYGTFHFLKLLQTNQNITSLNISERPKIDLRILNHWDNLDRTSERGYAGFSIWDWHRLPEYLDQRYTDYARANASIGINGTVLTNVNANALVLTPEYLEKVKALADLFRPYGIRVYLTARFSAPIEIGGLETADPLNEEVVAWWAAKTKEIYSYIPDFGGYLVKANSEGQPGPQDYGRSHADGANMLAKAVKPYDGIVMWRAFVYSEEEPEDRAKQAYNEFKPLDGTFEPNVLVQVKNGPIDFQPREPYHPLFGAMPDTPLMMEFQITQEYLGQATHLVYLAPMYKECLASDTYAKGRGSTVAKVIDGSLHDYRVTGIAGVANIGTDINWTGHPMAQSNWYAYGRLAWNPEATSDGIAKDWIRMTFTNDEEAVNKIRSMLMDSWETCISYMTPLGLHHLMGTGHHYGPAPWVANLSRADWTPVYYHRADTEGIGFNRTTSGSDAVSQYFPEVAKTFNNPEKCPEKFLLWFHHVSWDYRMNSRRTLWEELAFHYQEGVNGVRDMRTTWEQLKPKIDAERHQAVDMLLGRQEKEATWWKDASLTYFQTFSDRPIPDFVEKPLHSLEHYQSQQFPFAPGIRPRW